VTLTTTNGTLMLAQTSGLTFSSGADGSSAMTVTGVVADINAALNGMSFKPNLDYVGPATIQLTTDDQGNSGSGPAGVVSSSVTITVTAVNDAPVLTPIAPLLTSITEDDVANGGQTIVTIVGASITDPDASAQLGVAITGRTSGNGSWQYSIDGGSTWNAVGTPSDTAALLLRASDLVRFVPNGQDGTTATLTYRAWDQTSGVAGTTVDTAANGGSTAFSVAKDTATINVAAVNDAPVADIASPSYVATEQTVLALENTGLSIDDVDAGGAGVTATLSVVSGTLTVTAGTTGVTVAGSGMHRSMTC